MNERSDAPTGAIPELNPDAATGARLEDDPEVVAIVDRLPELAGRLRDEIGHAIVGQDEVVSEVLVTLFSGGHALLEGVPGLAKTLLVNSVAGALSLDSGRVQFTPDLMPSDVTGSMVVVENPQTKARSFVFRRGPVFVNVLLADEINRSPPKTQAALLEAMAEHRVTAAGARHKLPDPFFVLATQNPIEHEGTYTLPEAQLDRFLMKVTVDYPSVSEEAEIIHRTTGVLTQTVEPALERHEVLALQRIVRALPVSTHVLEYATRLVRRSRPDSPEAPSWVRDLIAWGGGPRAAQSLVLAAKAHTLLSGRFSVTRSDVRAVCLPVLRHRIVPSFQAEAEEIGSDELVARLIFDTSPFSLQEDYDAATRKILRF